MDVWLDQAEGLKEDKVTEGIFAPWCMYREDFLAIGGHDELFAPQSKEDSDLFNRFVLNGYEVLQSWDALVYHFTSRGSRFNKHAGGAAGKNSEEWLYTTNKNMRNFIRKWGTPVLHDSLMKPIVPPKYDIGMILDDNKLLEVLEPWCNTIYTKGDYSEYITKEQPNTLYDLRERIKPFDNEKNNEILIQVSVNSFGNEEFSYLQQLPQILQHQGQPGQYKLGGMVMDIVQMNENQNNLIQS